MTRFAIDTCSFIALHYSSYLKVAKKNLNILTTKKILSELEEMSTFPDDDGRAAREILNLLPWMKIMETQSKSTGEEELVEVALHNDCDFIVSDDIRAIPKMKKANKPLLFSTHLLYYLYKTGIISKEEGLIALERMRNKRSWKENIIYITGIQLFR